MGETSFGVRAALQVIERATAFEGGLRNRTEGLTWMVWGLVAAGFIMTADALLFRLQMADYTGFPYQEYVLLALAGWAVVGVVLTYGLWHTAALTARSEYPVRGHVVAFLVAVAVIAVSFFLSIAVLRMVFPQNYIEPILPGIGMAWMALSRLNLRKATPFGQRMALGVGALLLGTGLVLNLVLALSLPVVLEFRFHDAVNHVVYPTMAFFLLVIPFAAGLYQVTRG